MGMWLMTSHIAFCPQVPGQGSAHLLRMHALSLGHSALTTHSGLHPTYGSPWYSGLHVHTPLSQRAFDPQGVGLHGSTTWGSISKKIKRGEDRSVSQGPNNAEFNDLKWILTWRFWITTGERIASVTVRARTNGRMVDDGAVGALTARTRAWVATFLVHASFVARTFGVDGAFGPTVGWASYVCRQTRARRRAADIAALRVEAARRRNAWISVRFFLWWGSRC